ncbi:M1 aminopeptidase family protein [Paraglaciecola psychrophila]|uniref:hypothetical protein n=1 Tax=Paraglaciecola psychrophila TaxID=326544 RepID=UPI001F179065|nr:hypothetical protein [Paraglaciecola psychrophila]
MLKHRTLAWNTKQSTLMVKKYLRDKNGLIDYYTMNSLTNGMVWKFHIHEKLNDAWLHKGFGLYMQPIYSLYKFGEAAYTHSMYQSYLGLVNRHPVVMEGVITSDQAFNSDIYSKGGWTFHTLRWLIGDELFWQATRELLYAKGETYNIPYPIAPRYRNTQDFINIVNRLTGEDYTWLFEVYLKQAALPELKQTRTRDKLVLKWQTSDNLAFPMPITISINGESATYTTIDDQIILEVNKKDHIIIDPKMKVLRYLPIIVLCKENQAKRDKKRS